MVKNFKFFKHLMKKILAVVFILLTVSKIEAQSNNSITAHV